MNKTKALGSIQKYTMVLVLVLVVLFFSLRTGGKLLLPQNITNLISQNAYVFVLATGMLLCILTGGNIDLSVGSVVCFAGAVGALMMQAKINMWLAVVVMLAVGLAIGAWQAFWIAFMRIPPFITTLSGMLVFRGLSNVLLKGQTVSVTNAAFVKIFGGGADCYIPDFFGGGAGHNILAIVVGVVGVAIFAVATFLSRASKVKKGYATESLIATIVKTVVIGAVAIFFAVKLSQYKGIHTALIWVALVVAIYSYITGKTTIGRHFYAVGGNEKARHADHCPSDLRTAHLRPEL